MPPLEGKCLTSNVVYQATVIRRQEQTSQPEVENHQTVQTLHQKFLRNVICFLINLQSSAKRISAV